MLMHVNGFYKRKDTEPGLEIGLALLDEIHPLGDGCIPTLSEQSLDRLHALPG